jgi:DNA-binding response OmpR family regulator
MSSGSSPVVGCEQGTGTWSRRATARSNRSFSSGEASHTAIRAIVGPGSYPVACERSRFWYETRVSARPSVLVVDDEQDVRTLIRLLLERGGFDISEASNGREALRRLHQFRPDLVVLDVTMPDLDGWQTLERIRDLSDVPVLMLTARATELDKVRGLKAGADDYVTKPFGRQELLARVEALLRRSTGPPEVREAYSDGAVQIDFASREIIVEQGEVQLTPLEFRLLAAFVRHPNQVLSREQLLDLVWGDSETVAPDQVKLYVGYLRRKLGWDAVERSPIETVRGFGYRYRPSSPQEGARPSGEAAESPDPT